MKTNEPFDMSSLGWIFKMRQIQFFEQLDQTLYLSCLLLDFTPFQHWMIVFLCDERKYSSFYIVGADEALSFPIFLIKVKEIWNSKKKKGLIVFEMIQMPRWWIIRTETFSKIKYESWKNVHIEIEEKKW
jgi:hypothetical protein